ncbi:hypothetical protein R69658_08051 [Paraburkholderia aspalathi]|uniref:Uncharacterized protein n=1 Tax=Paraburkholderia aspalathi TaxID=1324617 RepID=A0ABM8T8N9_9BURK|nr:hypothetical protein [Paraburkholderia aspalathi]MBK3824287.1 hypothetical protein [Paraburkholderia aspalathi]MBK3836132.1 hypothetical protein [Paraburkholderia aspalathi]MBK3865900.1 hypothetical protein [Paraburkholderia aspalathi]CAE6869313.1 hypothetical protein R69658_08051 [Paraburkholderia aspalathi]
MQLKNDVDGRNTLDDTVLNFYRTKPGRDARVFLHSENVEWGVLYSHFLIDRKHVIRCGIGFDRGIYLYGVELGIGPHYFGPPDFWSYENSERFKMEASTESITHSLRLLDEFWGV